MSKPKTVAEYIAAAPKESRKHLREMRDILKRAAPKASEEIRWREVGMGPNRKAGAAWLRGGVAEIFSRKLSVTAGLL